MLLVVLLCLLCCVGGCYDAAWRFLFASFCRVLSRQLYGEHANNRSNEEEKQNSTYQMFQKCNEACKQANVLVRAEFAFEEPDCIDRLRKENDKLRFELRDLHVKHGHLQRKYSRVLIDVAKTSRLLSSLNIRFSSQAQRSADDTDQLAIPMRHPHNTVSNAAPRSQGVVIWRSGRQCSDCCNLRILAHTGTKELNPLPPPSLKAPQADQVSACIANGGDDIVVKKPV